MLDKKSLPIDLVHVPVKRVKTLDHDRVLALAELIMEHGQTTPIRVRKDGARYVLIEGFHRLEAMRALGETFIEGYEVNARMH